MSIDPEDFKDKPETCRECGRGNVWRTYSWQMRVCEECQENGDQQAMQDQQEEPPPPDEPDEPPHGDGYGPEE